LTNIRELEKKYQRPANCVQLLAVSKTKPLEDIVAAYHCGQHNFGENYVQEAITKIEGFNSGSTKASTINWHYIGPIQKNKTRLIAEHFQWVHSIDRVHVAQRLNDQNPCQTSPLQVCIQVNIDNEPSKSGIAIEDTQSLAESIAEMKSVKLRGLMAIPQASSDTNEQRTSFAKLRQLLEQLNQNGFELDTLSMGMSNDLEAAIAEGATIVRIGTSIFGKRETKT